ncbi:MULTISPECIES: type IV pilus biogenesis protein PilM [Xanthomonas]|uniref:type IV pilus biogenesis protein PilM n=1 Tax=Xanthomonas TaxID=338 RepID=UPI00051D9D57|nr:MULTISPECIES: type IV pilus biogenesis protein PilM [Xanthomonas]KGK66374.1 hypothetical protein NB99_08870 [Xanthomonas citri pv. fuscans]KGU43554.1 hypothetical protein NY94_11840 [Xanthomonas phaseoli pv. phaseoli]
MGAINYVLGFLILGLAVYAGEGARELRLQERLAHERQAGTLISYARAAARYARANPEASGSLSPGQLTLPAWLMVPGEINAYVENGRGYAYATFATEAESFAVIAAMGAEANAGVKKGGIAMSSGINRLAPWWPVPQAIPERAAVVFF